MVSVEISPYGRFFRGRKSATLRATLRENLREIQREEGRPWRDILSHSAIQGVFLLLKEPYEWQAATAYASEAGSELRDIDLSRENLRALLRLSVPSLSKQVEDHYRRAGFLFSHPPSVWLKSRESEGRELIMAQRIRRLFLQAEGKKLAHIGGWEHLLELPEGLTLYNLLKDLRPRRLLLEEAEK